MWVIHCCFSVDIVLMLMQLLYMELDGFMKMKESMLWHKKYSSLAVRFGHTNYLGPYKLLMSIVNT